MTRTSHLPRRLLAVLAAVGLGLTLLPAAPASAASHHRAVPSFFGVHDGNPATWPNAAVGSIRLWDSGVAWRNIETSPGVYDFSRLDAQVDTARAHGARVLLVLGMTPRFHSTRPGHRGAYGLGSADMPTKGSWINYVYKVVNRYKGRHVDYQVWNEANVRGYWRGSPHQMALLTKWASRVVNNNDRSAKVIGPALATRLTSQRAWLRQFYAQSTGGRHVAAYIDAVSLNLYPLPKDEPEDSMRLLDASRTMLSRSGVHKPIWNTEINYGLLGGGTAAGIARAKEASFVARTYVLNAANGVKRVFWYAWDLQQLANTQLTYANGESLTRAGLAYQVVRGWLLGTRVGDCSHDRLGTWTCEALYAGGVKRIYWNPHHGRTIRAVKSATYKVDLHGNRTSIRGGAKVWVTKVPVMVHSRR